jgi:AmmeMemoRadiSam system protein B
MSADRPATFAGRFYPGQPDMCARMVDDLVRGVAAPGGPGAIVPHAGWVYSGATAALGLAAIAAAKPETVVIFGAVHVPDANPGSVYPGGAWHTPLGPLHVDEELAARFARSRLIVAEPGSHRHEHSIEVQLPLLLRLLPGVRIVPIMVRPSGDAPEVGRWCATEAFAYGRKVAFVGSTDLTHYGPAFGFESHGRGQVGIRWAKEVNDRRIIKLIQDLDAGGVLEEAEINRNACGAGAIAATIAAMRELGATRYEELRHTCSAEVDFGVGGEPESANSVGYEAGVFLTAA